MEDLAQFIGLTPPLRLCDLALSDTLRPERCSLNRSPSPSPNPSPSPSPNPNPIPTQARGMSAIDLLLDLLRMAAVDEEVALNPALTPNPNLTLTYIFDGAFQRTAEQR